jgi:transposase InsO family protein
VRHHQLAHSVEAICRAHGITRQAYYQGRRRRHAQQARHEEALRVVRAERQALPRLGTRKLYHVHREAFRGLKIGRDALFALLRQQDLLVKRKRSKRRTTDSGHGLLTYQNLVQDHPAEAPNQVYVADITYVETLEGFRYAALVTDAYSRKIVGYDLSASLSIEGSLRALQMALSQAGPARGLIHHSDRGVQYCSRAYVEVLAAHGARVSMAAVGNPYENALAERVNGILKGEFFLDGLFVTEAQARAALREAVRLYNERRPHLALAYRTPSQVHAMAPMSQAA